MREISEVMNSLAFFPVSFLPEGIFFVRIKEKERLFSQWPSKIWGTLTLRDRKRRSLDINIWRIGFLQISGGTMSPCFRGHCFQRTNRAQGPSFSSSFWLRNLAWILSIWPHARHNNTHKFPPHTCQRGICFPLLRMYTYLHHADVLD